MSKVEENVLKEIARSVGRTVRADCNDFTTYLKGDGERGRKGPRLERNLARKFSERWREGMVHQRRTRQSKKGK